MLLGTGAVALLLALPATGTAAVRCGVKTNPPYGGSYDAFNLPSPPGTFNAYYSFWSSPVPYYARRREADGTIRYEMLRPNGGQWDFANCTNGISTNAERRTQLQNSNVSSPIPQLLLNSSNRRRWRRKKARAREVSPW